MEGAPRESATAIEQSRLRPQAESGFEELRKLLVGPEQRALRDLTRRLDDPSSRVLELSEVLPAAVRMAAGRDHQLSESLRGTFEILLKNLVRHDPSFLAGIMYPVIGSAIRKAITAALESITQNLNLQMEQSFSIRGFRWRFEAWRTGRSYGDILLARSLLYRVEQVFLIHRATGILLQEAAVSGASKDPDLVSAMLMAMQDFVRDSLAMDETLETIKAGEYSIWIQHGPAALLAAVVRGTAPHRLGAVFHEALETIHRENAPQLEEFAGNTAVLGSAQTELERCLLGHGEAGKTRRFVPAIFATALAAAALIWLFVSIREYRRWDQFVRALQSRPGIVITSTGHDAGQYFVKGLRDPLSADPAVTLSWSGLDPAQVKLEFEPYVSMAPALAAARRYEQLRKDLTHAAIFFRLGESDLSTAQLASLRDLSRTILALLSAAREAGHPLWIRIRGGSDSVGSADANAELCRKRASNVMSALVSFGVSARDLQIAHETSADSGQAGTPDNATLARTVSFEIASDSR